MDEIYYLLEAAGAQIRAETSDDLLDQIAIYGILGEVLKALEIHRKALNEALKKRMLLPGEVETKMFTEAGHSAEVQHKVSKLPVLEKLLVLISDLGLSESAFTEEVTTLAVSPSKVERQVDLGAISAKAVKACYKTSDALVIRLEKGYKTQVKAKLEAPAKERL